MATNSCNISQTQAPQKCRAPRQTLAVKMHLGQVARTLDELCALGLVEKFRDEYNIVRYRTVNRVSQ
jgi:hypothetical protein